MRQQKRSAALGAARIISEIWQLMRSCTISLTPSFASSCSSSSPVAGQIPSRLAALVLLLLVSATLHAQWEIEDSHTTASLRGIHNVGGGVAWASGTNGTVLRTRDDGKSWQTCPIPLAGTKDTAEKLDFRGIQSFDENTAIVMSSGPGDQSRLYKTTDGCQTWKLLFTNPDKDGFWDALATTGGEGIVIGDAVNHHFPVFASVDKDLEKWDRLSKGGTAAYPSRNISDKAESLFAASNSVLKASRNDIAFVSHSEAGAFFCRSRLRIYPLWDDFEAPFSRVPLPLATGESAGAFSFARSSSPTAQVNSYVVVGGDFSKPTSTDGTAAYSLDGGRSWDASERMPHGYRSAVAYEEKSRTWITVGPNGTDISTDDGRNWRPLTPAPQDAPDADKNWNALSLPFVVGPKGRIGKLRAIALPLSPTSTREASTKP